MNHIIFTFELIVKFHYGIYIEPNGGVDSIQVDSNKNKR